MAEKEKNTTGLPKSPTARVIMDSDSARRLLLEGRALRGRLTIRLDPAAIEKALIQLRGGAFIEVDGVIIEPAPPPDPVDFYESLQARPDIAELMSRLAK
jgi:hypothetical protein